MFKTVKIVVASIPQLLLLLLLFLEAQRTRTSHGRWVGIGENSMGFRLQVTATRCSFPGEMFVAL